MSKIKLTDKAYLLRREKAQSKLPSNAAVETPAEPEVKPTVTPEIKKEVSSMGCGSKKAGSMKAKGKKKSSK